MTLGAGAVQFTHTHQYTQKPLQYGIVAVQYCCSTVLDAVSMLGLPANMYCRPVMAIFMPCIQNLLVRQVQLCEVKNDLID